MILKKLKDALSELINWSNALEKIKYITNEIVSKKRIFVKQIPPWGEASKKDLKYIDPTIPGRPLAGHTNWGKYLCPLLNRKGLKILEIGSRAVNTNAVMRNAFHKSDYTGFDFHPGPNVDVVGDAHKLTTYFEKNSFDAIVSSAVFEHLAFPWIVAEEIAKLLKPGGIVFVETHFSYSMHEMPWHFFQFSHKALEALFNEHLGFETIESGVENPMIGRFSYGAAEYLVGQQIVNLYCHSGYLGKKKTGNIPIHPNENFNWRDALGSVYSMTEYPKDTSKFTNHTT